MITGTGLSENFLAELMDDLGLSSFLLSKDNKCSSAKSPFTPAVNGWNYGKEVIYHKNYMPFTVNSVFDVLFQIKETMQVIGVFL